MKYQSTRGGVSGVSFIDAVMMGLAPDRGLLVPESIPKVPRETLEEWSKLSFADLAFEVISLYVSREEIGADELRETIKGAYSTFRSEEVTPLHELKDGVILLELFHGPTYAFKDVALQFLGRLFELILNKKKNEDHLAIVGATSGDTGSSAIQGVRGRRAVECFILYPLGRTSKIQEAQMATVEDENVHAIALQNAEFDDCQKIVKGLFANKEFRARNSLGAVNSINWARIVAQIVYYFYASFRLAEKNEAASPPVFSVPTGNFGDILAGWYAAQMGCSCSGLIVATNSNDILAKFFHTGTYERPGAGATPTVAPSMDICVSSNFERLVYHAGGNDSDKCAGLMADFENTGKFAAPELLVTDAARLFKAGSVDKSGILETIKEWHSSTGYVLDPHTACGVHAALELREQFPTGAPLVCLACAHHAKFPDAVEEAIGRAALDEVPPETDLVQLLDKPLRNVVLPNSASKVAEFIESTMNKRRGKDGDSENGRPNKVQKQQ